MSSSQGGMKPPREKIYTEASKAAWPYRLPSDLSRQEIEGIHEQAQRLSTQAQYGWGHTIDFGPFRMEGLLKDAYLQIAGFLDEWQWWPASMEGMAVADVGCFTGGLSLLMSARGAERVYAIDEIPSHLAQCAFTAKAFDVRSIECVDASLYELPGRFAPSSLDFILVSGVLYHLSDMLVGLLALQSLLKPGGVLVIESNAVRCFEHSYANFGRFYAGMWWQPTALCIQDMCEFAGLERPDIRFYTPERCLARATKNADARVPFKRGMNWRFADLRDDIPRPLDAGIMAPPECDHE